MRGKGHGNPDDFDLVRITPAYAGKSIIRCTISSVFPGSPPPMRGKAPVHLLSTTEIRITPAYAGKSNTGV